MPWDNREEFTALHEELRKEYLPRGPSEEQCVLDLTLAYWHKQNLWRLRTATVLRDPFTREILATGKDSWSGIRTGLRKMALEDGNLKKAMEAAAADVVSHITRLTIK